MCQAQAFPTPCISIETASVQSFQNVKLGLESLPAEDTLEPAVKRSNTAPFSKRSNHDSFSRGDDQSGLRRSMTVGSSPAKRSGSKSSSLRRLTSSDSLNSRIEDMRNAFSSMKRSSSRKLSSSSLKSFASMRNSDKDLTKLAASDQNHQPPKQDPHFFEMIKHDPTDPEERTRYNDTATRKYIRRHPEALQAQYDFQVGGGHGRLAVRRYPLFALIALDASLTTIKMAIKANPAALEATKDFNTTALHTACSWPNIKMDVVQYIYNKYPAAIRETTKMVYLPLHNACQTVTPSLGLIKFLVKEYPEGLMAMNKLGDTPLRTAQRNPYITHEVLEFLQNETTQVFGKNEENAETFKQVALRQSWGSSELKESLCTANMATLIAASSFLEDHDEISEKSVVSRSA